VEFEHTCRQNWVQSSTKSTTSRPQQKVETQCRKKPADSWTTEKYGIRTHEWGSVEGKKACRLRLKCDGTRAETRFRLSAKWTSPFKSAGASVPSTTGSRGVRISGSNAGYTMFRGSVKGTGYPLHSPVSPSFPFPCVTVCHNISTRLYGNLIL